MKKNILWVFVISPLFLLAQSQGIFFENNLSWQQILEKAKNEHKYVFVDCYATWCGPCKLMDKNIYPMDSIGDFMNKTFISVKIQMDTTNRDDAKIQQWYGMAHAIEAKYHIAAYPTYIFFSPEGVAVHKDMGGKDINSFLAMAIAAMDPQQQYYTLLTNYRKGDTDYTSMPVLANAASRVGQDSLSEKVARDYIHNYLEVEEDEQKVWTRENIIFLNQYISVIHLNDAIFKMYFHNREKIDATMKARHFADRIINYIIYRDKISPMVSMALNEGSEPNWHRLEYMIRRTYADFYAKNNIILGQLDYYERKKLWKNYVRCFIKQQELKGIDTLSSSWDNSFALNNAAYEVFKYSVNNRELKEALCWINLALPMPNNNISEAQELDTKANILYKLGRKTDALALEEKSHSLSPRDYGIIVNYEKMKSGQPTWSTE
jgi:thioredoxin-related protein